jgi:two-component system chemotaxis response regulator CheB
MADKINIFVVDDSAIIRKILNKILSSDESFNIVGQAEDGQKAIDALRLLQGKMDIHIIIMDIEMPVMDGYTALPHVKKLFPKCRVIVASTLTQRGAEASIKALAAGASEYIPKPNPTAATAGEAVDMESFSRDLLTKTRILGKASQGSYYMALSADKRVVSPAFPAEEKITLLPNRIYRPRALAIGSSTGGPEALQNLLKALNVQKLKDTPIFITQHMPAKFTNLLAANLTRNTGFDCVEGENGEVVRSGKVYIAPGDYHMKIARAGADHIIRLDQGAQINYCRPSVDPMLYSLTDLYGDKLLFVMLTGMGADGLLAAKNATASKAIVLAQDKETSTVWGMPGAVAKAGICSKVAPISEIAKDIMGRF